MSRYFPSYYPPQQDPYSGAWPYDYYAQPYGESFMRPAPYFDPYNTYRQMPYQAPVYPYEPQYPVPVYRAPQYEPQGYPYAPAGYPYQYDYQPQYQAPVYPAYEPAYQAPQYQPYQYEQQVMAPQYHQQYQVPQYQPAPQYQQAPVAPQYQPQPAYQPQYQAPQPQYQPAPQFQQAPVYPEVNYQPQQPQAPQWQPQAPVAQPYNQPQYQAPQYQPAPQPVQQPAAPATQPVPQQPVAEFAPKAEAAPAPVMQQIPQPAAPAPEMPVAPVFEQPKAPVFMPVEEQPVPQQPASAVLPEATPAEEYVPAEPAPAEEAPAKAAEEPVIEAEEREKSYMAQFSPAPMHYNPIPKKADVLPKPEPISEPVAEPELPVEEPAEEVAEDDVFVFAPPKGLDLSMGYLFRSFEEKLQEVSEPQEVVELAEEPVTEDSIDEMIAELDNVPTEQEEELPEYEVLDLEPEFTPEAEEESLEDIIREVMQDPAPVAGEEPIAPEAAAEAAFAAPELSGEEPEEEPAADEPLEAIEIPEPEETEELSVDEALDSLETELLALIEELEPAEAQPEEESEEEILLSPELQELLPGDEFDLLFEETEDSDEADYEVGEHRTDDRAAEIFPIIDGGFELADEAEGDLPEEEPEQAAEPEFIMDIPEAAEEPETEQEPLMEEPAEESLDEQESLIEESAEEPEAGVEASEPIAEEAAAEELPEEEEVAEEPVAEVPREPKAPAGMDYEGFGFPDPTTTREISRRQIMEALEEKMREEQRAAEAAAAAASAISFETGEFIFPDLDEDDEADYNTGVEASRSYEDSLPVPEVKAPTMEPAAEEQQEEEAEGGFSFDDAFSEIDRIEEELKKAVVLRDYVDCYSENNLFSYKQRPCYDIRSAVSEFDIQYGDEEPKPLFDGISFVIPAASCTAVVSEEPSAVYELVRYLGTRHGAVEAAPSAAWPGKLVYIDGTEDVFPGTVLDYLASHAGEDARPICSALLAELGLAKCQDVPMSAMDNGKRALLAMLAAETDAEVDAVVVNFEDLQPQQEDISRFGRLVNLLCRQGTSVVLGCCSADLAGECANYIVALTDGSLAFAGSYIDFTDKYCSKIMTFVTPDEAVVRDLSRMFGDLRFELSGDTVTVCADAGSAEIAEQLIEAVLDLGVDMDHVVMVPKSFESAVTEMLA